MRSSNDKKRCQRTGLSFRRPFLSLRNGSLRRLCAGAINKNETEMHP